MTSATMTATGLEEYIGELKEENSALKRIIAGKTKDKRIEILINENRDLRQENKRQRQEIGMLKSKLS